MALNIPITGFSLGYRDHHAALSTIQVIRVLARYWITQTLCYVKRSCIQVTRPSYIRVWGETKIEKHIPLSMVIDIIIEQGCLQSMYGLHTFKIESIAHGKAASVDELRVQGVHNPGLLRKVIITQASKIIQDGRAWNPNLQITGGERKFQMESLTLGPAVLNSPSKGWKTINSPRHVSVEPPGVVTSNLMIHKLDEVSKSVRKLEFLVEKNQVQLPTSCLQNV